MELTITVWLIGSLVVAIYAAGKGLSGVGYFFGSLLISPLLAWIVALISIPTGEKLEIAKAQAGFKKCPDCAEFVRDEANICRYCRHEFDLEDEEENLAVEEPDPLVDVEDDGGVRAMTWLFGVVLVGAILYLISTQLP